MSVDVVETSLDRMTAGLDAEAEVAQLRAKVRELEAILEEITADVRVEPVRRIEVDRTCYVGGCTGHWSTPGTPVYHHSFCFDNPCCCI